MRAAMEIAAILPREIQQVWRAHVDDGTNNQGDSLKAKEELSQLAPSLFCIL